MNEPRKPDSRVVGDHQDPDDIATMLKHAFEPPEEGAELFSHTAELDGMDLSDDSLESSLVREDAQKDGVVVPDLPERTPAQSESSFDTDPVADAAKELQAAFHAEFDFGSVTIDQVERDRFYRCGLHDTEMRYDVAIPGADVRVRVAIPPTSRSEAAVSALDAWVSTGFIGTNSVQYLHGFQLLNVWLMVRAVNDEPTEWYERAVEEAGGKLTYRALRALLSDPDTVEPIREINEVRWQALSLAVRIADHKHQLCLDAVRTRKVFTTAGSD